MATTQSFVDYINGSFMMDHMEKLEAETDEEITLAFQNLGSRVMQEYPTHVVSAYRKAAQKTEGTWAVLQDEWEMALTGGKTDSTDFYRAYDAHQARMDDLHPLNNDHTKVIDLDVARKLLALLNVLGPLSGYGQKFLQLKGKIAELQADLQKMKKKVRSRQTKLAIDAALNGLVLFASPASLGGRLALVVGKKVVDDSIDALFGSGRQPSSQKTAFDTTTSVLDVAGKIDGVPAKALGAITGLAQLQLDAEDVAEAQKLKDGIDKKIAAFEKQLAVVKRDFVRQTKGLKKLLVDAQKSYQQAVSRVGGYSQASSAITTKKKVVSTLKTLRKAG